MNRQEFKKEITKGSKFELYYYYFISVSVIIAGLFFLYKATIDFTKLPSDSIILMIIASVIFIGLGVISLVLIPNRYKIITFECKEPLAFKKSIIADTMKEFDSYYYDDPNCFWVFIYKRKWWTFSYYVYLTTDSDSIYLSVIGSLTYHGGFIDFRQTERLRNRISTFIKERLSS